MLNTVIKHIDFKEPITIGEYLKKLLIKVVTEEECFNGKRPFGSSGWKDTILDAFVESGVSPSIWIAEQDLVALIEELDFEPECS